MKIVIALDSFKGSCSAQAACAAVAQGLRRVDQTLELVEMPVSDGGEGLLSTLADSPLLEGAVWQQQRCTSPYGLSLQADFLILPGERAIIEMAVGSNSRRQRSGMCVRPAATGWANR